MAETNNASGASSAGRTAQSIRRIMREYNEIRSSKNPYWTASPILEEEPYEWHFTVRGPVGTEFEGGIYHGRVVLPQNYPLAPPSFTLLNQNGRFEVGRKVCLSASNYHPELWQPAWGIRTMLDALHAFFATPADGAVHSLNWSTDVRRKLADESRFWKCPVCKEDNATLVSMYCEDPTPIRPELPSSMIPASIARSVPYLRPITVKNDSASGEDKDDSDRSPEESISSEIPRSNNQFPTEEREVAQQSEEQRRRRRQLLTVDQPAHHSQNLTVSELLRIFIILPFTHFVSYFFDPSIRNSEKSLFLIDVVSVILVLSTGFLIADIVFHPASLASLLLIDDPGK